MPYPRGLKWVGQVRAKGRRIERIFWTKAEAKDWEQRQKRIPAEDWKKTTGTAFSLGDWFQEYLDFSGSRHTPKTYEEKKAIFKRLALAVDPTEPAVSLHPRQILEYLTAQARERSGYAANKDRKNLVAAWNWGTRYREFSPANPCKVDRFPEDRAPRYIPPEKDFWKVYRAAGRQDKVMLLAYLHLGARRSELFRLTWDDVDLARRTARLATRKRKDGSWAYDTLPLTDRLAQALRRHKRRAKKGESLVFPDPQTGQAYQYRIHIMHRLCERAKVRFFGFHAIRHLTASILASQGIPAIQIQRILRHRALATTERYLHGLDDLRKSMEAFSKRKK